uniref:Exodeoxyribonuclease I n=1 Tax=SAR324 cluster bacterium TaxID=2024889 RepID=A0A2A4T4Q7_9DELT
MNSYLFYDIESSGLNKAFDQVMQFAAIRTDMEFNELERHNFYVQLRPDVIISPQASITHHISIADCMDGLCEFEAIQKVHEMMNEPGTISLGYNTLGFDDEFLRFSFYRNLLPPYTHQYAQGCSRMDLLPMITVYRLFNPKVLEWPELNGKPSLKLEYISSLNQLATGQAHDALVDVEATIALAKRLAAEGPMWEYLKDCFNKSIDEQRLQKLPVAFQGSIEEHRLGLMISPKYGSDRMYQSPLLSIGKSRPYSNQTLWLRLDLPELQETTLENIDETTWVERKRLGEPGIILPPLPRYWAKLSDERKILVEANKTWLQENPVIFEAIIRYHQEFKYPEIPDLDTDAALYQNGFLSRDEQALSRKFQHAGAEQRLEIIGQFPSAAMRTLASRLLFRNYPEEAPSMMVEEFALYLEQVNPEGDQAALVDYKGGRRTTPLVALHEITELKEQGDLDLEQLKLLEELEEYIQIEFS